MRLSVVDTETAPGPESDYLPVKRSHVVLGLPGPSNTGGPVKYMTTRVLYT